MKNNILKNLLVFLVVLGSIVFSVNSYSQSYASRLRKFEKTLGSETQAGLYSQNYKTSHLVVEKGIEFLNNKDLNNAEIEFNKAISISSYSYQAYAYLGIVEMERKNYEKAIKYHKKAMDTFRSYKKNVINRKREFIKDLETSAIMMEKIIDTHGLGYESLGSSNISLANSFQFQTIREKNPGYHMSKLNDIKGKVSSLKKSLLNDLRMSYPPYFFVQYGNCYQMMGDLQNAIKAYKNALRIDPKYGLAYSNLASTFYMAGDKKLAEEFYRKAKKLNSPVHPALVKEFN